MFNYVHVNDKDSKYDSIPTFTLFELYLSEKYAKENGLESTQALLTQIADLDKKRKEKDEREAASKKGLLEKQEKLDRLTKELDDFMKMKAEKEKEWAEERVKLDNVLKDLDEKLSSVKIDNSDKKTNTL